MWRYVLSVAIVLLAALLAVIIKRPQAFGRNQPPVASVLRPKAKQNPDDNLPFEYRELAAQQHDMETLEPDPPKGATALCADGAYGYEKRKEDACRDHRGLYKWFADTPPHYK